MTSTQMEVLDWTRGEEGIASYTTLTCKKDKLLAA